MALGRIERLQIMLTMDELVAIDDWRLIRRMPSRAAALRELIKRGLAAEGFVLADRAVKSKDFGVVLTKETKETKGDKGDKGERQAYHRPLPSIAGGQWLARTIGSSTPTSGPARAVAGREGLCPASRARNFQ